MGQKAPERHRHATAWRRNSEVEIVVDVALPILEGNVRFLFQSFLVITIVFAGATYAFGNTSVGVEFLLKKILLVGGTLFLITNWLDFTNIIVSSLGVLGLRIGGLSAIQLTTADLFSPARIAGIGFEYADDLLNRASEQAGYLGTGYLSGEGILLVIAALVMGLSFIIIALQVFMLLIEFKLVTLGAFILIPFAIMDRTTSLAQDALGYVHRRRSQDLCPGDRHQPGDRLRRTPDHIPGGRIGRGLRHHGHRPDLRHVVDPGTWLGRVDRRRWTADRCGRHRTNRRHRGGTRCRCWICGRRWRQSDHRDSEESRRRG
jgi:hypothetical protein